MASNPVRPVDPVPSVSAVRAINSGNTYWRNLEMWRFWSEVYAEAPRAQKARQERAKREGKG